MKAVTKIVCVIVAAICAAALLQRCDRIDRENNAFAKECNDRGGYATFDLGASQCHWARYLPRGRA